ncbi:hypothetical protein AC070_06230 [Fannyhessea vaginae]|nr:hypothetical protein AC070_06230 [Fannyhessea vaginae]
MYLTFLRIAKGETLAWDCKGRKPLRRIAKGKPLALVEDKFLTRWNATFRLRVSAPFENQRDI